MVAWGHASRFMALVARRVHWMTPIFLVLLAISVLMAHAFRNTSRDMLATQTGSVSGGLSVSMGFVPRVRCPGSAVIHNISVPEGYSAKQMGFVISPHSGLRLASHAERQRFARQGHGVTGVQRSA